MDKRFNLHEFHQGIGKSAIAFNELRRKRPENIVEIDVPNTIIDDLSPRQIDFVLEEERKQARFGRLLATLCLLAGLAFTYFGAIGSVDVELDVGEATTRIVTSTPGVLLIIIAGFILWQTAFRFRVTDDNNN